MEVITLFIFMIVFSILMVVSSCQKDNIAHEKWNKCMEITKDIKQCNEIK